MKTLNEYLNAISKRGDRYGRNGGILDLLLWCDKQNTQRVTIEEARQFYEDPDSPYQKAQK
jgi:hypothetical protein